MITSNYHIEMAPGDAGLNDRFVIQDVIKEMASSKNIATVGMQREKSNHDDDNAKNAKKKADYKVVVLVEVDKLTRQAQAALRRTMEKYSASCRLILCCNNPSKVIDPVRSRCLGIRVGAPNVDEVSTNFNGLVFLLFIIACDMNHAYYQDIHIHTHLNS